jgi:hypothetical protein
LRKPDFFSKLILLPDSRPEMLIPYTFPFLPPTLLYTREDYHKLTILQQLNPQLAMHSSVFQVHFGTTDFEGY